MMATDQPPKSQQKTEQDTAIPADLFRRTKALLDEIYAYGDVHPLAATKLCIKMGISLRQIECASANKAHDKMKLSWARIADALNLPGTFPWEHYRRPNPKRVRRLRQDIIDKHAEDAFR